MALSDKLQISLITCNRAEKLRKTLATLADSPFAACLEWIYDNGSTDRTSEVCESFSSSFANLKIIKRKKNIGGCANFMEALTAPARKYKWVLCDDDHFDLTVSEELISWINSGQYDVILSGSPGMKKEDYGYAGSIVDLIARGTRFYFISTFLPGLIFKHSLLDDNCLKKGYDILHYLWPHMPLVDKLVRENRTVKVLGKPLIHRGYAQPEWVIDRSLFFCWCRSACVILKGDRRESAIREYFENCFFLRSLFTVTKDLQRRYLSRAQLVYLVENLPRRMLILRLCLALLLLYPNWLLKLNTKISSSLVRTIRHFFDEIPKDGVAKRRKENLSINRTAEIAYE